MSCVPSMNQVPPRETHEPSSNHMASPQNVLFSVPPPPIPPVAPPGYAQWWPDLQAGAQNLGQNSLRAIERASTDKLTAPLGSTQDELWLSSWLARRQRAAQLSQPSITSLKIFEASRTFKTAIKLTKELQQLHQNLEASCTTLPCEAWSEKWKDIADKQREVNICLSKISDPDTIKKLKLALLKRKRKRISQRNERTHRRIEKIEYADKIRQLHKNIDTWLDDMQDSVERAKREESLKVEADQVLSEVTRKKAEARRQLSVLSSLLKLRQLRARTWASRGENVSAEAGVQFTRVIDSLRKVWEDQLQVYSVEERGLKVMLEGVVEERNQKQDKREREIIRLWEQLLFGGRRRSQEHDAIHNFFSAAERDIDAFVLIRGQWDKFLAPPGAPMSSAIPLGWVLPVGPSSEDWAKLQENKNVTN